jgi:hypothetical protein
LNLKSFDWRRLKHYFSPQAAGDLNIFLEKLPQNAGQSILIAAGIAWAIGAAAGLFATMQTRSLTELRATLAETKALQPAVPKIRDVPVSADEVKNFAAVLAGTYPGLMIKQQGPAIYITSPNTGSFGQFREAIGHVQNGGSGWRVNVEKLCVGRECDKDKLAVLLKINKVSVDRPQ